MHSVRKPWWQQATALVTVTTGGMITGFNFVPGAAATMTSPTSVPLHLLALEQAARPGAAMNARAVGGDSADSATGDALLRSAIVNVAKYYLQIAATRSPAQMEALIWDNTSLNGADHGPSCAAFASLTLELAAQAVGQQSWVSGGTSYPFPLPAWADVRVDTNPASPAVTSVMADAQAHDRWHPVDDSYRPQPGDWVLFGGHVEVVTRYSGGVLDTIGADSNPGLTVNAHSYGGSLADDGVVGFVDNGHRATTSVDGTTAAPRPATHQTPAAAPSDAPTPSRTATSRGSSGGAGETSGTHASSSASPKAGGDSPAAAPTHADPANGPSAASASGQAVVPGLAQPATASEATNSGTGPGTGSGSAGKQAHASGSHGVASAASAAVGSAVVPGVVQPGGSSVSSGSSAGSGTGSSTERVEDRGHAAVIPGTHAEAAAPATSASSGAAAVPGASPAAVAPAAHASAASGATSAATPGASSDARPSEQPTAAVPGSTVAAPTATPSASASASATPSDAATPGASASPTASGSPSASASAHATAAPTAPASSASAKPEHYRQYSGASQATPGTRTQQAFISLIAPGSVAAQQRWGVPAAVTIAQAIEESSWGNSQLAAQYHNLFGIKGSGPAGSIGLPTSEFYNGQWVTIDAQFRVYHNVAESIADHAELLATSGYYQRAMADRAIPDAFANDLTGVYATDPDYGANLIAIMKLYNLYRFDGPTQSVQPQSAQAPASASPAVPAPAASSTPTSSPTPTPTPTPTPAVTHSATAQPTATHQPAMHPTSDLAHSAHPTDGHTAPAGHAHGGQAAIPGLGSPALSPTEAATATAGGAGPNHPAQAAAPIPGVVAPTGAIDGSSAAAPSTAAPSTANASAVAAPQAAATPQTAATPRTAQSPQTSVNPTRGAAAVPGLAAATVNYQRQASGTTTTATTAARYQPQFTTAMTTAYFATAKGPLGHGEHLYRDVAAQTGIRWELLAACDWMQCKAHPRYSPVHGEKIGALNADGTSYATKSAALGQCARDLIELAAAVYGIDLTARRLLSVRSLADAFAAFRWGALLRRHGVSAMEFPYSVAGLTAQHQKMHWPVIEDPAAPDRPGARFREPFGAVPVVLSLDYPATVLTDRKRRQPRVPVPYLAPATVQLHRRRPADSPRPAGDRATRGRAVRARTGGRAAC
ncbi:MAG TPA: glucosaminidase domain-containing protein [Trebonia sp.]|nr:glucosaminidase domain-containing protein [Trebonia sp.]